MLGLDSVYRCSKRGNVLHVIYRRIDLVHDVDDIFRDGQIIFDQGVGPVGQCLQFGGAEIKPLQLFLCGNGRHQLAIISKFANDILDFVNPLNLNPIQSET